MPNLQFGPWTRGIVNSSRDYTLPKSDSPGAKNTIAVLVKAAAGEGSDEFVEVDETAA